MNLLPPLCLAVAASALTVAGLAPVSSTRSSASPVQNIEILAYGTSRDRVVLEQGDAPDAIYTVPRGHTLIVTDIDAVSVGLVLLRQRGQRVEQVGLAEDIGVVGRGQAVRSYVTGIRFEAGDKVLVDPSDSAVEWVCLRGRLVASSFE
jgi:hypothetical protein